MNLFERIGISTITQLDRLNKKHKLVAIHSEPDGARVVMADSSTFLIQGLDKDETTRLFKYLGFNGSGPDGFDTPAFAPHIKPV